MILILPSLPLSHKAETDEYVIQMLAVGYTHEADNDRDKYLVFDENRPEQYEAWAQRFVAAIQAATAPAPFVKALRRHLRNMT